MFRPTLAELDYTVSEIEGRFKIMRDGVRLTTMYDSTVNSQDPNLFLNNHVLNSVDRDTFVAQEESLIYVMRLDPNRGLIEVIYTAIKGPHDGDFLASGLVPAQLTHTQSQDSMHIKHNR